MSNEYKKYQEKEEKQSPYAEREGEILNEWNEKEIFAKTTKKDSPKGEFVFFEGPPTANGRPGIHHLAARAFKDAIPRYKTMQGYNVRRKGGWDTHGLPVELQVEKQLGLKSKLEIEDYGIEAFNQKCKESVWEYKSEWEDFTRRIGFWVDLDDPYITYDNHYMESVWWVIKKVADQNLIYKDYKVVPWCPRCGTTLSSHELAQGYEDVKDISITAKFELVDEKGTYLLAWTTTPWTLPGNVALAVGEKIDYVKAKKVASTSTIAVASTSTIPNDKEHKTPSDLDTESVIILAKSIFAKEDQKVNPTSDSKRYFYNGEIYEITEEIKGSELVGKEYKPLFPYFKDLAEKEEIKNIENAYKVYAADFVTTTDGTGIVHTAVMYGQDDFELGNKVSLPKMHVVKEDGTFVDGMGDFSGRSVKEMTDGKPTMDIDVIKHLQDNKTYFSKEKYEHSYPHCWRCKTPLIYYARDSWYINMQEVKSKMIAENQTINWEPSHIKDGRFGEWLKDLKDWAISRERYWGTPLPIWQAEDGEMLVAGSIEDIKKNVKKSGNKYFAMRHGQSESNVKKVLSTVLENIDPVTEKGEAQVRQAVEKLKSKNIDLIVASPFMRTKMTAELVKAGLKLSDDQLVFDKRLVEVGVGEFEGKNHEEYHSFIREKGSEQFHVKIGGGESSQDVMNRVAPVLYELEEKYRDKNILFVSHGTPLWLLHVSVTGHTPDSCDCSFDDDFEAYDNAEVRELDFVPIPHDSNHKLDLHKPFIDEVVLEKDGKDFKRVKEVMDVWFDSGSMPFAQEHYPFENKDYVDKVGVPADFISEGMDQTRGWFYTLHAIGNLVGKGKVYKNVISLGLVNDEKGQKMSKSKGNTVNPWDAVTKFGVDSLRFWMYSVNGPGESKNFDEKTITETQRKVFGLLDNVVKFYEMYSGSVDLSVDPKTSPNVLDRWILEKTDELEELVTKKLDAYQLLEPTRAIRELIGDLSQWYIRRSRDRFKGQDEADRKFALATTRSVLERLSILMAPFTPFFAEDMYGRVGGKLESVHLENWAEIKTTGGFFQKMFGKKKEAKTLASMQKTRAVISEALELRSKANINVRQPLASLTITEMLDGEYLELIADELNVKEVVIGPDLAIDTVLTPELEIEGKARDLLREVQKMRKEAGLNPEDRIRLTLPENNKDIYESFSNEFQNTAGVVEVDFGGEIKIDKI